jgi:hypothetical protein
MMTKTPAEGMVELAKMAGGLVEAVGAQEAEAEASFDNMPI